MPAFGQRSQAALATADPQLQALFSEVIRHFDCTVIVGHRTEAAQNAAVAADKSKTKWPRSKHNCSPSLAVDVVPYPIDWGDRERITYFAGVVKGTAVSMGIKIRWGGDWDSDTELKDNSFDDLVHFELVST